MGEKTGRDLVLQTYLVHLSSELYHYAFFSFLFFLFKLQVEEREFEHWLSLWKIPNNATEYHGFFLVDSKIQSLQFLTMKKHETSQDSKMKLSEPKRLI